MGQWHVGEPIVPCYTRTIGPIQAYYRHGARVLLLSRLSPSALGLIDRFPPDRNPAPRPRASESHRYLLSRHIPIPIVPLSFSHLGISLFYYRFHRHCGFCCSVLGGWMIAGLRFISYCVGGELVSQSRLRFRS